MNAPAHVLILAGSRGGKDAVAAAAGVSHKALAKVAGVPMLERVTTVWREALPQARLAVAIDRSADIDALIAHLREDGPLDVVPPGGSPAATVAAALAAFPPPILIATGDHPLLTAEMVRHFLAALPPGADAAAAVARRETVEAVHKTRRTYWRFADGDVSGCNLFYLGPRGAAAAVAFWRTLEADRKKPLKVVRRLGFGTLVRFVLGRLTLADALSRLGTRIGAKLAVVDMPFAESAIDVDRPSDLALAEIILKARRPCA
jgi:GTP:adenosylcobinamide-phosphate guanylyltransferase